METQKKTLTMGKNDVYFEVIDQLNISVLGKDNEVIPTTFSKLRPGSSPSSKTTQAPNVIPLASKKDAGPLHDLKPGAYRHLLEKKGLVRCSLTPTNCELTDPTQHALKNKCYSGQYGGGFPKKSGSVATQFEGFYPLATIQQGNFVFSFFQNFEIGNRAKMLIWSVATFENALQSGELQGMKGDLFYRDKATQLIVKPTTLSPVVESKTSFEANGSSFPDTQVQFTFGAPLQTIQGAFDGEPSFFFCWVEMVEGQFQGKTLESFRKLKPVETTPSALTPEEVGSYYQNENIDTFPFDDEEKGNGLELVEGNVYTIGRHSHCVSEGWSENILAGFETPNYSTRYGFSLREGAEDLLSEALNEAESSPTFSIVEADFDFECD